MDHRKIVCVIALLGALVGGPPAAWSQEYRIGFVAAITGPASSLGGPERDVAVMLQKELDAAGGLTGPDGKKRPVRIIIHDDQSKADETIKAVKKLVADDKVHVVIASSQSPTSLAVVPIVTEARVPLISMASSHAIVTPVKDRYWVFKTPQSNIHVAVHQVNYLRARGIRKIASLYVNDAFGEDSRRGLAEVLKGTGIEAVYEDKFEHADKDMTPQLTRVRASGAEALIVHAIPPSASIITPGDVPGQVQEDVLVHQGEPEPIGRDGPGDGHDGSHGGLLRGFTDGPGRRPPPRPSGGRQNTTEAGPPPT